MARAERLESSVVPTVRPSTRPPTPLRPGLVGWLEQAPGHLRDLATIIDMLPDVLFKCEKRADGKIYWLLNEGRLAEEFGLTTEKVRGKPLEELFPPPVVEHMLPHFERCFEGEAHDFVNELGGRFFYHYPQPIYREDGSVEAVVGFISEVTGLKRAEDEIRRLNQELEARVQELETANRQLEAYSYSVSHDLRNPLATMDATAHLLASQFSSTSPRAAAQFDRLSRSVRRMDGLIDDILTLAKATRGELRREKLDLTNLAREVCDELGAMRPERTLDVRIDAGLLAVGDPRLVRVVFENLFSNAWKYTQNTERPVIEFSVAHHPTREIFCVRDNGAGFDMAHAEKLFNAFERAHAETEFAGMGVGLATVRRIVRAHGGEIWAEGEPGKGASFFFTLAGA
ncbi:MAG: PAS domain S-box protein [Myxococcales bacterium]|nr:PAS domain S-box protein [Myxococcales bacterium]